MSLCWLETPSLESPHSTRTAQKVKPSAPLRFARTSKRFSHFWLCCGCALGQNLTASAMDSQDVTWLEVGPHTWPKSHFTAKLQNLQNDYLTIQSSETVHLPDISLESGNRLYHRNIWTTTTTSIFTFYTNIRFHETPHWSQILVPHCTHKNMKLFHWKWFTLCSFTGRYPTSKA